MTTAQKARNRVASAPRGTGATLGGAVAIMVVWIGSLEPSIEQMGALTTICAAALEWLSDRFSGKP